jgi:Na+/H+ antiporter NhaD/arsenite permease-like protein
MIGSLASLDLTSTGLAWIALAVFVMAYVLVVLEDFLHLRKSKPVVVAAGIIWVCVALAFLQAAEAPDFDLAALANALDLPPSKLATAADAIPVMVGHHVMEYGQLFLFLMVAMTYISAISERNVFLRLNAWLISAGFSFRAVYWLTGALAFCISPIADNMTTALLMGAVVVTVGKGNKAFVSASCVNIVVAANAGGAFSPFGDITTLMVWQAKHVDTFEFLGIFFPSLINWLIPAIAMSFAVPKSRPDPLSQAVVLKDGWLLVTLLFLATIATAVAFHMVLHLPPFLGMTTGLGYLMVYNYRRLWTRRRRRVTEKDDFDVFSNVAAVEWDTMLFFFGVVMCVGGLREFGFLAQASKFLYGDLGAFQANIGIGLISAVLDNVPVMFAVLGMQPDMNVNEWLLVTLTAGVGGSIFSIGSAAGVALMGSAHGKYTFMSHLKWTPFIVLGYAASIGLHVLLNGT